MTGVRAGVSGVVGVAGDARVTHGYVYFLQDWLCGGPIKIGYSRDPVARCMNINRALKDRNLRVLAAFPGDRGDERRLHVVHDRYRVLGEWFRPADPILEAIELCRLLHGDPYVRHNNGQSGGIVMGKQPRVMLTPREKILLHCKWVKGGCWRWTGSLNEHGYATLAIDERSNLAHRVAYEAFIGPIPEGHELDHICTTKDCVNPMHVEPVTRADHATRTWGRRRKNHQPSTHCRNGHPRIKNARYGKDGVLLCRACIRAATRRYRLRRGMVAS